MNTVTENADGTLSCSCGAKSEKSERNRFRKRHPSKCQVAQATKAERIAFSKKLAQGTRHQDSISFENNETAKGKEISTMLTVLASENHYLTEWEEEFIESVSRQWKNSGWMSEKQFPILVRIYKERCLDG